MASFMASSPPPLDSSPDFDFSSICCPITEQMMESPVILSCDGYTYEQAAIEEWIRSGKQKSPVTDKPFGMSTTLIPNYDMIDAIEDLTRNKCRTNSDSSSKNGGDDRPEFSGVVVPLCAFNPAVIAAKRKNERQIAGAAAVGRQRKSSLSSKILSLNPFGRKKSNDEDDMLAGSPKSKTGGSESITDSDRSFINDTHKLQLQKIKLETDKQGNRYLFEGKGGTEAKGTSEDELLRRVAFVARLGVLS